MKIQSNRGIEYEVSSINRSERTVTFTMEDALISPEGFMILSGAGLIEASEDTIIYQHVFETTDEVAASKEDTNVVLIKVKQEPYLPTNKNDNFAYIMVKQGDDIVTEPIIPEHGTAVKDGDYYVLTVKKTRAKIGSANNAYSLGNETWDALTADGAVVLVDYYTPKTGKAKQINITPDKFGGNYYLEASTLFRDTNGVDMPAEFIVPNCKIQSNFTFTMASSGDPSSFTFTMDAFPDYTRFDPTTKVLAAIQIIEDAVGLGDDSTIRPSTIHSASAEG